MTKKKAAPSDSLLSLASLSSSSTSSPSSSFFSSSSSLYFSYFYISVISYVLLILLFGSSPSFGSSSPVVDNRHSFKPPFYIVGSSLPYWNFAGSTVVTEDYVRLTPAVKSKAGYIWNQEAVYMKNWEVIFGFRVSGAKNVGADGFAFWAVDKREEPGPVFGNHDRWNGLGIFFDTFDNDGKKDNPRISAVLNNGQLSYNPASDGKENQLGSCRVFFRNPPVGRNSVAKITYQDGILEMAVDASGNGVFDLCFGNIQINLPEIYYFGLSAATGELVDNHDITYFLTYDLSPGTPTENPHFPPRTISRSEQHQPPQQNVDSLDRNVQEELQQRPPARVQENPAQPPQPPQYQQQPPQSQQQPPHYQPQQYQPPQDPQQPPPQPQHQPQHAGPSQPHIPTQIFSFDPAAAQHQQPQSNYLQQHKQPQYDQYQQSGDYYQENTARRNLQRKPIQKKPAPHYVDPLKPNPNFNNLYDDLRGLRESWDHSHGSAHAEMAVPRINPEEIAAGQYYNAFLALQDTVKNLASSIETLIEKQLHEDMESVRSQHVVFADALQKILDTVVPRSDFVAGMERWEERNDILEDVLTNTLEELTIPMSELRTDYTALENNLNSLKEEIQGVRVLLENLARDLPTTLSQKVVSSLPPSSPAQTSQTQELLRALTNDVKNLKNSIEQTGTRQQEFERKFITQASSLGQTIQENTSFGFWGFLLIFQLLFGLGFIWWWKTKDAASKKFS